MNKLIISVWTGINVIRSIPAILVFSITKSRGIIIKDINRWVDVVLKKTTATPSWKSLHYLLLNFPEFRNLFYYRITRSNLILGRVIQPFYPRLNSLYIHTSEIGPGLIIYHGFSTIISAKKIGENCSIGQQVTIGKVRDNPTIEDGVAITAGAFVVGGINIGKNSTIGANATVTKDVPANCVVVGNPAYIVRKNGFKIKQNL